MSPRLSKTGKEDLRQRRSKRYLSESLLNLLEERPYREISVVDICDRAMVHRTTFYAHFQDKNDLFQYVINDMLFSAARGEKAAPGRNLRAAALKELGEVLPLLRRYQRAYLVGLSKGVCPEGREIADRLEAELRRLLEAEWGDSKDNAVGAPLTAAWYAGAVVGLVRWWLENDMPIDEQELLTRVEKLLPPPKKKK